MDRMEQHQHMEQQHMEQQRMSAPPMAPAPTRAMPQMQQAPHPMSSPQHGPEHMQAQPNQFGNGRERP